MAAARGIEPGDAARLRRWSLGAKVAAAISTTLHGVRSWELTELDIRPHAPQVLDSTDEGRAIVIELPAGQRLGEHQVHERGWLIVVSGRIDVSEPGGGSIAGGPGLLIVFDPNERHEVAAAEDARLLLMLSPWPGDGHPSQGAGAAPA